MSERHACRLLGQWRGTQRYEPNPVLDEDALTRAIVALGTQYGRYGYRRITALLRSAGWEVGKDRVQRIWRREGLKVPQKQRSRGRLWLNDGSCVRLRPERANHVWSYDFVSARTHEGKTLRLLTLIDEYTRECLAIRVERRMGSQEVIETLSDVMLWKGIPAGISDLPFPFDQERTPGCSVDSTGTKLFGRLGVERWIIETCWKASPKLANRRRGLWCVPFVPSSGCPWHESGSRVGPA